MTKLKLIVELRKTFFSRKRSISFIKKTKISWFFFWLSRLNEMTSISQTFSCRRFFRFFCLIRLWVKIRSENELLYRIFKELFYLIASSMRLISLISDKSKTSSIFSWDELKSRDAILIWRFFVSISLRELIFSRKNELKSRDATLIWEFFVSIFEKKLIVSLWCKRLKSRDAILTFLRTWFCSAMSFVFQIFWFFASSASQIFWLFAENRNFSSI
jgi:hypothetical protein